MMSVRQEIKYLARHRPKFPLGAPVVVVQSDDLKVEEEEGGGGALICMRGLNTNCVTDFA